MFELIWILIKNQFDLEKINFYGKLSNKFEKNHFGGRLRGRPRGPSNGLRLWSPCINHIKRNPSQNFDLCAPNNNCNIVYDQRSKESLKNAAAVIFTPIRTLSLPPDFNLISKVRQKHQLWMFYQWESPEYHRDAYQIYDNFFNGTMSYRKDSSFFNPYGSIIATKLQKFYENKANLERFPMKELTDDILDEYLISKPDILNLGRNRDGGVLSVISNCWSEYRGGRVSSQGRAPEGPPFFRGRAPEIAFDCEHRGDPMKSKKSKNFNSLCSVPLTPK